MITPIDMNSGKTFRWSTFWSMLQVSICILLAAGGLASSGTFGIASALRSSPQPSPDVLRQPEAIQSDFNPIIAAFSASGVDNISITSLGPKRFIVAYNTGSSAAARVAVFSGGMIHYGPEAVFNSAQTAAISVDALTQNHFVISFIDFGDSLKGKAVIGYVETNGDTITYGSKYTFNNASTGHTSVQWFATSGGLNYFVIAFQDTGNSNYGTAVIGSVPSGSNVITFGSEYVFNSTGTGFVSVAAFYTTTTTSFVIAYSHLGSVSPAYVVLGTNPSGTLNITFATPTALAGNAAFLSAVGLSENRFVVVYRDKANSGRGVARFGELEGTVTIVMAPEAYPFYNEATVIASNFGVDRLDDTNFLIAYKTGADLGRVVTGTIIGSIEMLTVTYGVTKAIHSNYRSDSPVVATINIFGDFAVCWSDMDDSNRGKCRLHGSWPLLYLPMLMH